MVENWLITGGSGFIGTSLIERILQDNQEAGIRVFDNLIVGSNEDLSEVCQFRETGIDSVNDSLNGEEIVVGDIRKYKGMMQVSAY